MSDTEQLYAPRTIRALINGYEMERAECKNADDFINAYNKYMEDYMEPTLVQLQIRHPSVTKSQFVPVEIMTKQNDSDKEYLVTGKCWTECKGINNETSDGYCHVVHITDTPIVFMEYTPYGMEPIVEQPLRGWLFKDINHMTGYQVDYVAEPIFNRDLNWGFNGLNAAMIFRQMCEEYQTVNKYMYPFVIIWHNPYIGYWMGTITDETIAKYFKPITLGPDKL